jgi:hypothetical protein
MLRNVDGILNDYTNSGGCVEIENPGEHEMSCYVENL